MNPDRQFTQNSWIQRNKKLFQNSCFISVERQLNIRPVLYSIETLSKKLGFATMMMMSFCAQATCPLKCKLPLPVKGHNFSTSEDALVQSSKGPTEENPSWNLTDYSLWALILINPTFREIWNQNFSNWLSHKNWEDKEAQGSDQPQSSDRNLLRESSFVQCHQLLVDHCRLQDFANTIKMQQTASPSSPAAIIS
jgi:hypothetical protein